MSENEQKRINPQITKVEIDIREMRDIEIYPLSMADQLNLTDLLSTAIGAFAAKEDGEDIAVVAFIVNLVKENLGRVLSMITGEDGTELMKEITNLQAASIAEQVYETNYGVVAKNFESLSKKLKTFFPSERPLPQFANDTPDTDSKIFTENPTEKEELPSDS